MPDHPRLHRPLYRVFHLGPAGGIVRAEVIEALDDDAALLSIRAMAADHACELWDRARYVAKVEAAGTSQAISHHPLGAIAAVEQAR